MYVMKVQLGRILTCLSHSTSLFSLCPFEKIRKQINKLISKWYEISTSTYEH